MNYNISVDLKKLKGTFVAELQGKSSSKDVCAFLFPKGRYTKAKRYLLEYDSL